MGWFQRLSDGLSKTRQVVRQSLDRVLGRTPDPAMLEELEAALLSADLGVHVVDRLMTHVREHARGADAANPEALQNVLSRTLYGVLAPVQGPSLEQLIEKGPKPFVVLMVGVNGVGKTTTIAKMAQRLVQGGRRPLLVAGDTFRAAAIDQLQIARNFIATFFQGLTYTIVLVVGLSGGLGAKDLVAKILNDWYEKIRK